MEIKFISICTKWDRLNFEYRITIGKESTSFFTGIGWITKKRQEGSKIFHVPKEYEGDFARVLKPFGKLVMDDLLSVVFRREPLPSDVAESLLSDIEAGSMSFNEFCDNFGYSNDSLKALDTYRSCMDLARKFKKGDLIKYLTDEQKEELGYEAE